ncbi:MAG: MogA/MoaB family molybdenum cofactor biosynthesis protein [Deltaproteobacteria bacterium]|nr:MogA/MoaB family molybdenum cofactor biosynthesis protein [Deltaproteobacteria bacterium]
MYRAAVMTASDKGSVGEREDLSGGKVKELLEKNGFNVVLRMIVPDERDKISSCLTFFSDVERVNLVVTTGGTGFSPRDLTPEATLDVADRLAPGLAELMRAEGCKKTPRAALSRGVAVIRGQTLIINVPGSPKGAAESLEAVLPILDHALEILSGQGGECAVKP